MEDEPLDSPGPAEQALLEDQALRARLRELDDALKRKRAERTHDGSSAGDKPDGRPSSDH